MSTKEAVERDPAMGGMSEHDEIERMTFPESTGVLDALLQAGLVRISWDLDRKWVYAAVVPVDAPAQRAEPANSGYAPLLHRVGDRADQGG